MSATIKEIYDTFLDDYDINPNDTAMVELRRYIAEPPTDNSKLELSVHVTKAGSTVTDQHGRTLDVAQVQVVPPEKPGQPSYVTLVIAYG